MDYEKEYLKYYNKIYAIIQHRVKIHYIEQYKKRRDFNKVQGEIKTFFSEKLGLKVFINNNDDLKSLSTRFKDGKNDYFEDKINLNCENEIHPTFDLIDKTNFPKGYNFDKFLFQIAFVDAKNEIARLLHNNNTLFSFFYFFNEYDNFEIKDPSPYRMEDTEIYRNFQNRMYPPTENIYEEVFIEPKETSEKLDTQQIVILIEKLIVLEINWELVDERKRASVISKITGTNSDNIRKILAKASRKPTELTKKYIADVIIADKIINELG